MAKATTTTIAQPALQLDVHARAIVKACKAFDAASAKFSDAVSEGIKLMITVAQRAGVEHTEKGVKHLQKCIRETAAFAEAVDQGLIERKTITEYAQGAARAFYHGVEWTPRLKNDPDMALPWSGAKAATAGTKAGKVESTDRAALDQTISKMLKQARLLGLTEYAANVLDLTIESLEGFKEAAE